MNRRRTLARRTTGTAAAMFLLAAAALAGPTTAPASAGPLPCLAPASATLYDAGAVLKWQLATYRVTTRSNFWSVVATRGSQGYDSDIVLFSLEGCAIGESRQGDFIPSDWVAFDNNSGRLPAGAYATRVLGHPGETNPVKYNVQFVEGGRTLSTSTPAVDQPIGASYLDWIVDIRDVYLSNTATYTFTATGGFSSLQLLGSSSTEPATWARTPGTAVASASTPVYDLDTPQTATLTFRPAQSGWYGALFVRNGWWGAPVSVRVSAS
ncbi:hypothetical protein [Catellatospora bangladeshensis]|uniref:Uncharacterized protein n=1 Tax=Catellatospora bangladeshensis TaxID=310355 RepID=A0A8J3NGU9_9ACTN|nr:hypothetical protein [Catellatospora bangladeshensis]GIF80740.1 hypothetical protein Cba03nite_20890 [Catellatospora bangladeshensis]